MPSRYAHGQQAALDTSAAAGDDALVAGVRASKVKAFDTIYLAHYEALCAFVIGYVRSRALAEEIVQDILCHIWERRTTWSLGGSTLRGYLYCATRNSALNALRRQRVELQLETESVTNIDSVPPGMGESWDTPDIAMDRKLTATALAQAVDALPVRCREAITLRWHHRLSRADTARAMGITVKGVEALLTRGVKQLREMLSDTI